MFTVKDIRLQVPGRVLAEGISFSLSPGECVLLCGANGAGKTTLLNTLVQTRENEVRMVPTVIPKVRGFSVSAFARTGCYRESSWNGKLSTAQEQQLQRALELLGIAALEHRDIASLSDGEFRRACLASALVHPAQVLLLDEPTAFLDVESRSAILGTLREVARSTGTALLFSSHDLYESLRIADRVFALTRDGRFLVSRPSDREKTIRQAFPGVSFDF